MSALKIFCVGAVVVFSVIGTAAWIKKGNKPSQEKKIAPVEVVIQPSKPSMKPAPLPPKKLEVSPTAAPSSEVFVEVNQIHRLFALDSSKLPIVETVSYTSRAPWMKGRPAWIADYANYYETSRHFIARSLNRKADYFTQKISPGDRFNVFRKDKNIQFHLLIDLSLCRLWFYCFDEGENQRILLKTYKVGVGRQDSSKSSGYLTPLGKYSLGEKVAIYKPGMMGFFQEQKKEMIQIFGTRWIPFEKEIEGCTELAKGYGLHGAPWVLDAATGQFVEDLTKLGKYDSDGCIRLASEDIEEIFAIVLTKPTTVELVKDHHLAKLPGVEKEIP